MKRILFVKYNVIYCVKKYPVISHQYPLIYYFFVKSLALTIFYIYEYNIIKNKALLETNKHNIIFYFLDVWNNNNNTFLHHNFFFKFFKKKLKKTTNLNNYNIQSLADTSSEKILTKKFFLIHQYYFFSKFFLNTQKFLSKKKTSLLYIKIFFIMDTTDLENLVGDDFEDFQAAVKYHKHYFSDTVTINRSSIYSFKKNNKISKKKLSKNKKSLLQRKLKKLGEGFLLNFKKIVNNFNSNFSFLLYSLYFTSASNFKKKTKITRLIFNEKEWTNNKVLHSKITNFTPIQILDENIRNKIKKNFLADHYLPLNLFINQYICGFLESFTQKKICLKIKEIYKKSAKTDKFIKKMFIDNFYWQRIIGTNFYLNDMLSVLYFSLYFKDLTLLNEWFCKSMTRLNLKKHKVFLRLFKHILFKYELFFLSRRKILGFKFDIRGKVGVAGNSKKRHFFFYIGETSYAKKSLRLDYQQGLVYTSTGVLGSTMILAY